MQRRRFLGFRPTALAALAIFAIVGTSAIPANGGQCRENDDEPTPALSHSHRAALQRAVDNYFADRHQVEGFSGISLYVSPSVTEPAFNVSSGSTSFQDGEPLCPNTLFEVGSITKSFTAVLLLKLEAKGVLDIHDTVGKWLPQYPAWSSITIEQLLNLTAPINDDYLLNTDFETAVVENIHRTFEPEELIAYAYPGTSGPSAPWHYINTKYILAGMIVSKATGMPYAEALEKMLLEPLQMHETYYRPRVAPKRVLDAMPSGYLTRSTCQDVAHLPPPCSQFPVDNLRGQDLKTLNLSVFGSTGGIVATLTDVTRWARALFSDTLLPPKQRAELFSLVSVVSGQPIHEVSPNDPMAFSLGIIQSWAAFLGGRLWSYTGQTFGYTVGWFRRPEDELFVAVGVNSASSEGQLSSLTEAVLHIFEPQNVVDPNAPPSPTEPPHDLDP